MKEGRDTWLKDQVRKEVNQWNRVLKPRVLYLGGIRAPEPMIVHPRKVLTLLIGKGLALILGSLPAGRVPNIDRAIHSPGVTHKSVQRVYPSRQ